MFVVMIGAYRFSKDLVKAIQRVNAKSEAKVELKPYFFKIEKNQHPSVFIDPIVTCLSLLHF